MLLQLIIMLILLFLSAFFSSAETSLFSISRSKAIHLAKSRDKSFLLLNKMKANPHTLLTTILIGNNIVNVGAASFATSIALKLFPHYAVGVATGVMTLLILIFGEVFPKSIATRNNILIAKITIFPIFWMSIIFRPAIWFLNFIPKLTGKIKKTPSITEEELMTYVEVVEEEGEIKEEEKDLIHNVFEFDNTSASEIMTPRGDMFVIDADKELVLKDIVESGFSRIPVIQDEIDNIIGIIHIKDIFLRHAYGQNNISLKNIMKPPYFVPEYKKLDRLLSQFKKRKNHIAIVVDEHGGVSGLITLEDVIEELVGEIRDETDKEEQHIVAKKSSEWLVLGKSDIDEVNETIGMQIPESKDYDTFSGYILDHIGRIPEEKEAIQIGSFNIIIKKMDGNRIEQYFVTSHTKT